MRSTTQRCRPSRVAGLDALAGDPDLDVAAGAARGGSAGCRRPCRHAAWRAACGAARRAAGSAGTASISVLEDHAVVAVGPGQEGRERDAAAVDDRWRFVPGLPRSVGFGPTASPPFWPGCWRCPGWPGSSRSGRLRPGGRAGPGAGGPRPRPPASRAAAASRSCREPQPISWGSISQGMPVLSTKRMPVRQARSGTRGRPPLGLGGSGGSSGANDGPQLVGDKGLAHGASVPGAMTRF